MTKHEAIRQLKMQINPNNPMIANIEAIAMAIAALQKEKELTPSANDASSKEENLSKKNDSTEKAKCQEAINDVMNNMIALYQGLSLEEQNIWNSGITYKRLLDVQQMIEEDKHDRH